MVSWRKPFPCLTCYQPLQRNVSRGLPGPTTRRRWTSFTLKAPYLLCVSAVSLGLVGLLEYLSKRSAENGGVVFSDLDGHFKILNTFTFIYLPTVIAVLFSLAWSWIELDVKRLEPYYQLSQRNGAPAEQALLLKYPNEYLPLVPIKALKRRHWAVFFAGLAVLVNFWAITPLQGAIFIKKPLITTRSVIPETISPLPNAAQAKSLDSTFITTAFGVVFLGEDLPGFVTNDYAVEPFDLGMQYTDDSTTWTSHTVSYSTQFTCIPAITNSSSDDFEIEYTFSDDTGCTKTVSSTFLGLEDNSSYALRYYGFGGFSDVLDSEYSLGLPDCPTKVFPTALIFWGQFLNQTHDSDAQLVNVTASFCTAEYLSQSVTVTVASSNLSILDLQPTGPKTPLSSTDFKITQFETVVDFGGSLNQSAADFPDQLAVDILSATSLNEGVLASDPVAFALATSNLTVEQISNVASMQTAFGAARKVLFALAINSLQEVSQNVPNQVRATIRNEVQVITVVRVFATLVEAFLCFVSVCSIFLLGWNQKRKSKLLTDPASIEDVTKLLPADLIVLSDFLDLDVVDSSVLKKALAGKEHRLQLLTRTNPKSCEASLTKMFSHRPAMKAVSKAKKRRRWSSTPFQITWYFGLLLITTLFCTIILLSLLYQRSLALNGLPLPTDNIAIQQILLNYIPIVFATFLEPILVLLARTLSVLQPFNGLFRKDLPGAKSIGLTYASRPPQLILWKALKNQHLLLASVSLITILANVLAVSLGSLFKIDSTMFSEDRRYQFRSLAQLTGNFSRLGEYSFNSPGDTVYGRDYLYVARANLSNKTPLPPWTTRDTYLVPVYLDNGQTSSLIHEVHTVGIGLESKCQSLTALQSSKDFTYGLVDGNQNNISATYATRDGGVDITCTADVGPFSEFSYDRFIGRQAAQTVDTMRPLDNESARSATFCQSQMFYAWIHGDFIVPYGVNLDNKNGTQVLDAETLFVSCQPSLRVANYTARTNSNGQILQYNQNTPFDTNIDRYFEPNANLTSFLPNLAYHVSTADASDISDDDDWHINNNSADWINLFLKATTNSTLEDPNGSLSDLSFLPDLEAIHRLLFAILMSLYPELLVAAPGDTTTLGSVISPQNRVFMNFVPFVITVAILAIDLIVIVLFYLTRPPIFLPRMPDSIASVLGFVAASRDLRSWNRTEQYRFGKFIGVDGKLHVGIEKAEHVSRLPASYREHRVWRWLGRKEKAPPVPPKN